MESKTQQPAPYFSKMYTIGKCAFIFANEYGANHCNFGNRSDPENVRYKGFAEHMPQPLADDLAEFHQNCLSYWGQTMSTLYKGYNGKMKKTGTENPMLAILSLRSKTDVANDATHVIVWSLRHV